MMQLKPAAGQVSAGGFVPLIAALLLAGMTCLSGCAATGMNSSAKNPGAMQAGQGTIQQGAAQTDSLQAFTSACPLKAPAAFCQDFARSAFRNSLPVQEFSPPDFKAVDYPTDSGTVFLNVYAPKFTAAMGYCYFVAKGRVDAKKNDPPDFAGHVAGFAILSSELPAYEAWLETAAGETCRRDVDRSVGLPVVDLKEQLRNKPGMVVLNPLGLASTKADLNDAMEEMRLTLNHERIHILQTACPAADDFAKEAWDRLDPGKKADFQKRWDDQRVVLREFLAYTYENDPTPLLDSAKGCKF
jgi:hypothetical protein